VDFITSVHDWLPATNADGTPRTKVTDAYRQNYRYYIGDAGQYSVSYAPQALPQAAGWHPLYWYKGTTNQWITEDVYFESLHRANRMKRDSRYTKGLVWQGSFLNDRVIPTLGFREDRTPTGAPAIRVITEMPGSADVSHHPFQGEIDEIVQCVLEDRETHLNVFDAQKTMEFCIAADRSAARGGRTVRLPLL
jgi:hypothetical protein